MAAETNMAGDIGPNDPPPPPPSLNYAKRIDF